MAAHAHAQHHEDLSIASDPLPPAPSPIVDVPLSSIRPSARNPRKTFDPGKLDELAASIKAKGVQSPVLLRPVEGESGFELVYGERRWRAASIAGLSVIPARIRVMGDQEALEEALIENGQRADVDEYEEAAAFVRLHKEHGRSADEIAAKVGKSLATVYARLKLAELDDAARELAQKEGLSPSHALLAARICGADRQKRAIEEIAERGLSFREAQEHVQREYMLRLADAQFDVTDAALVPIAGACTACPKRTGAQRELFAEVAKKDDLCLDAACHRNKNEALWLVKSAEARAGGKAVLDEKETKKVFQPYGVSGDYFDADQETWVPGSNGDRVKYSKLVGKQVEPVLARDPKSGEIKKLYPRDEVQKVLAEKRKEEHRETTEDKKREAEYAREQKKRDAERAKLEERRAAAIAAAEKGDLGAVALRGVVLLLASADYEFTAEMRGWLKDGGQADAEKVVFAKVAAMGLAELRGLLVETAIDTGQYAAGTKDALDLLWAGLGVSGKPSKAAAAPKKKPAAKATKPAAAKPAKKKSGKKG